MPTRDFELFLGSCFGMEFGRVHDGVNERAVLALKGAERKEAETLLLQSLGTEKDTYNRPAIALGLLRSKAAATPLQERFQTASGVEKIQPALALYRIEGFPEAVEVIVAAIGSIDAPNETTRLLAVQLAPELGARPPVVRALLYAMHEDDMVGHAAERSLRRMFVDDDAVRDLLARIMLVAHDAHRPDFVPRAELVRQATELIESRLND